MKGIFKQILLSFVLIVVLILGAFQPVQASDDSLAKIKAKGVIVMGTSPDYPPFEFLVTKDGKEQIVGADIDLGKKIAEDLGVKLKIEKMDFDSLLVGLETGKVDMVIASLSPTPERAKSVDFSKGYYNANQNIVVNKSDEHLYKTKDDFASKIVGAQTGSIQADLVKNQMPKSQGSYLTKFTDLILALKTHKIEGIVTESGVAAAYVKNDPALAVIDGGFDTKSNGKAIAFAKGSKSLVDAANKSLDKIKKQNLFDTYLNDAGKLMTNNTKNTSMLHYWDYFAKGVGCTLFISAISAIFGVLLGILLALMRLSHHKVLRDLAVVYIEFIRGSPLMVQIMFVYFGLGVLINIPALLAGIIAVSLNSAAYVAEIIRGGIISIPVGQTEAARSLGLSQRQTMQSVILPQAIKNIWPSLGNEFISLIKESSIVSIIGVTDLIYELRAVQTATYKGVVPILVAMVLYFIITFGLSQGLLYFERKMKHDD